VAVLEFVQFVCKQNKRSVSLTQRANFPSISSAGSFLHWKTCQMS